MSVMTGYTVMGAPGTQYEQPLRLPSAQVRATMPQHICLYTQHKCCAWSATVDSMVPMLLLWAEGER
jgi:hypothetical protein